VNVTSWQELWDGFDRGFIAYYRVSTGTQGKSGLGIEAQRQAVAAYLNGGNWRIIDLPKSRAGSVPTGPRWRRRSLLRGCIKCRWSWPKLTGLPAR
jgi:hypothetical protein